MSKQFHPASRASAEPAELAERQLDKAAGGMVVDVGVASTPSALALNFTRQVKAQDLH